MKKVPGWRWERRVPPNVAQQQRAVKEPPIKETLHELALLCHNHTDIL